MAVWVSDVFGERQKHQKKKEAREKGKRKAEKESDKPLAYFPAHNSSSKCHTAADLSGVRCGGCRRELAGRGVAPRLPSALRNKGAH